MAHTRWWRPELATLVVIGGIDPAVARRLGERLFGDGPVVGAVPTLPTARAGAPTRPLLVVIDMPGWGKPLDVAATAWCQALLPGGLMRQAINEP